MLPGHQLGNMAAERSGSGPSVPLGVAVAAGTAGLGLAAYAFMQWKRGGERPAR
jgi:hypothetical protein